MKRVGTYRKAEQWIIRAFQDEQYIVNDMEALLHRMRMNGANVPVLMSQYARACSCICTHCQQEWLHKICKNLKNEAKSRAILCTGIGKDRQWFYSDGMCYEASLANPRMTREQVIDWLTKVENHMKKLHRKQGAALKSIRETIKQLRDGAAFERPTLLQDSLWPEAA